MGQEDLKDFYHLSFLSSALMPLHEENIDIRSMTMKYEKSVKNLEHTTIMNRCVTFAADRDPRGENRQLQDLPGVASMVPSEKQSEVVGQGKMYRRIF
jgi:hypothetical protein